MTKKITLEEAIEKIVRKALKERKAKKIVKEDVDNDEIVANDTDVTPEPIEEDVTDTKLPGNVTMYLNKVTAVLAKQKLNQNQKIAVLAKVIDDLEFDKTKLNQVITRIKGTMPTGE